jgi:2-polyprenyl-3-methyl-5-hydroxy-6-metoxy-1,4-benzoquinol methylase
VNVFADISEVLDMGPFHALTLFQVLEHLDEPHEVILSLRGVLAKGGILVLETPDCTGVVDIQTRDHYLKIHPLEHINAFTADTMKDFAVRLGFSPVAKPVATVTCDSLKAAKGIAKRLLQPALKPTTKLYFRKD